MGRPFFFHAVVLGTREEMRGDGETFQIVRGLEEFNAQTGLRLTFPQWTKMWETLHASRILVTQGDDFEVRRMAWNEVARAGGPSFVKLDE